MKILIIHNYHKFLGGEETCVELQKKAHETIGDTVIFFSKYSSHINQQSSIADKIKLLVSSIFSFQSLKELSSLLKSEKPDIVFIHNIFPLISGSIFLPLNNYKKPIIQYIHNYEFLNDLSTLKIVSSSKNINLILKRILMWLLRQASLFLFMRNEKIIFAFPNNFLKNKYKKYFHKNKKVVIPQPVALLPKKILANNTIEKSKSYILYLGRLSPEKGVENILHLAKLNKNEKFIIAGDGELKEYIKNEILIKKISNVNLLPYQSSELKQKLLGKAKTVIIPSIWDEPFGLVFFESILLRTPVIVSNSGALYQNALLFKSCFIYEAQKIDQLKNQLLFINQNYKKVISVTEKSRQKVFENFSIQRYIDAIKTAS